MNISVQGAPIYFTIPIFGGIPISATLVVTWLIMAIVTGLCLWLTHDMKVSNVSKRQAVAEFLVETARNFTVGNMGEKFAYFTPFVAALFTLSLLSNLISLVGLYSPTADLSTEAAWAVLVFALITYHKIKANGFGGYLKGFTQPIPVLTPFNILSEIATPISMACIDRIERMAYLDDDPIRDAPANMTIEALNGSLPPADPMIHSVSAPVDSGLGI